MKRILTVFACTCILLCVPVLSVWAIWEGNAGIAATTEFPSKGMFARSDMFPKNTIVEIQNLETEITVRAVITGPSGVSGLVAVLSPDTAAALNIKAGSVSRVRISIPSAIAETPAAGTSSTGYSASSADPDVNPAVAAKDKTTVPLKSIAEDQENPLVPLPAKTAAATPAAPAANAVPAVLPAKTESTAAESPSPAAAKSETQTSTETVRTAEPPASAPAAVSGSADATPAVVAAVPVAEQNSAESGKSSDNSVSEEIASESEGTATPTAEPAPVSAAPEVQEPVAAETSSEKSTAYYSEPEVESGAAKPSASEETPAAEAAAVTLVPAEPNPPEAPETTRTETIAEAPTLSSVPVQDKLDRTEPVATSVSPAEKPAAAEKPVKLTAAPADSTALPYVAAFAKGSYYVQIASYSDPLNARKIVDNYGKKYPVVVERAGGKNGETLKVCIGPVDKDEYGAVLERFKSLGFKDAFVRKGQ